MPGPGSGPGRRAGPGVAAAAALLALLVPAAARSPGPAGCDLPPGGRFDCGPERLLSRAGCEARGCCYAPAGPGPPWCFFPRGYRSYRAENLTATATGFTARLRRVAASFLPGDVGILRLDVALETPTRLRFSVRPGPRPGPGAPGQRRRPALSAPAAAGPGPAALRGAPGHAAGERPSRRHALRAADQPGPLRHRRLPAARRPRPVSARRRDPV